MQKICIAIPTYNRIDRLKKLINSIKEQVLPHDVKIYCVVSNSSSVDGTTEYLSEILENQKSNEPLEFIVKNPDIPTSFVEYKENHLRSINAVPEDAEWTWWVGDDDILTDSMVLKRLVDFLNIPKNTELDFIHLCQARRSTKSSKTKYGTLFDLCNLIGFHEMLGWMSSLVIKTSKFKNAFNSELYKGSLSAYAHSAAILGELAQSKAVFLDVDWVEPQDLEQTQESIKRWQEENIIERYFYIIDDLEYLKTAQAIPSHLNMIFFRYLTYSLRDRYTIYVFNEFVENNKLTEQTLKHWQRVGKIAAFLSNPEELKEFHIWYKSMNQILENYALAEKIKEHAFQNLKDTMHIMNASQYPFTILKSSD